MTPSPARRNVRESLPADSFQAAATTSQPTTASSTQWLPVPTTTSGGHGRVGPAERAGGPVGGGAPDRERHPQRPARVQRRERRQLVGEPAEPARSRRLRAPPAVGRVQAEHVDVPLGEPRRRHREQQVEHQPGDRREEQGAASGGVRRGAAAVEPDQDHGGDDVVGGGVPVAAEQSQPVDLDEEPVERVLPVEAERLLDVEQRMRPVERRGQGVVGEQPGAAVGDVEDGDQEQLAHTPHSDPRPQPTSVELVET